DRQPRGGPERDGDRPLTDSDVAGHLSPLDVPPAVRYPDLGSGAAALCLDDLRRYRSLVLRQALNSLRHVVPRQQGLLLRHGYPPCPIEPPIRLNDVGRRREP